MKKFLILIVFFLIATPVVFAQSKAGREDTTTHSIFYTCPDHSGIVKHQPGKCPKCGMELNQSGKEIMKASLSKTYTCPIHIDQVSHDPGKCPKCGRITSLSPKEQMKTDVMKINTCPMHPTVALDKKGNCPKCGKSLKEKKNQ